MLLSLDPSSMAIGYALFRDCGSLASAGVIRPTLPAEFAARCRDICRTLFTVPGVRDADEAVIEFARAFARGRGGMKTARVLGFALGMVYGAVLELLPAERVHFVEPRDWTGNRSKAARTRLLAAELRGYDRSKDWGMDAADAIGLGRWWLAKHGRG